jgi:formimidoylglutamate deiminase
MPSRSYLPDLLYAAGEVRAGAALTVEGGLVAALGEPARSAELVRLPGSAILPGLVSAHGHAFQRAIRGRTERRAAGRSNFWSWREAMYAAASRLGPEELHAIARLLYLEMARAGVTTAGEFHYLHRDPAGRSYADPDELAKRVATAAREVGLRVSLLRTSYARAGFGRPAEEGQRRFVEPSPDGAVLAVERLASVYRGDPLVSFGLAPHSVRACPAAWVSELAREAERRGLPLHLHVSEQPREVEECRAEHGVSPVALLERCGAVGPRTTAVHAIHLDEEDVAVLGRAAVTVCACPTTERDLGDGVVPADRLLAAGARLALGVDSCVEVDLLAEARALEGHLRLLRQERGVLAEEGGATDLLARRLYRFASAGGMASLGLPGGALAPGEPADFVVVSLEDPSIAGATADDLLALVVFSMARTAVRDVHVAGVPVVQDGRAARLNEGRVVAEARAALGRLWS